MKVENDNLVAIKHLDSNFRECSKIEWFLGLKCNLKCSYCAEFNSDQDFAPFEKIIKGVDLLVKKIKDRKILLLLGGGEPSLHPDIHQICRYMAGKKINLSMITNGTMLTEKYVQMLDSVYHYTFSLHFEKNVYKKTLKSIFAVAVALEANNLSMRHLQVNVMLVPGYFKEIDEAVKKLQEKKIPYVFRKIRPNLDDNKKVQTSFIVENQNYYNKGEMDFMNEKLFSVSKNTMEYWENSKGEIRKVKSNANDVLIRGINRFKGWKCWVGVERLHIYPNGEVYRSTCKVGGLLGNIFDNFSYPKKPVICTEDTCACAWAINLSKVKNKKYSSLLLT